MTTAKAPKTEAPAVTTAAGFLRAYDQQVEQINQAHGWCSTDYAYSYTGSEDDGATFRIPRPSRRTAELQRMTQLQSLPPEYLTEAGRAAMTAENDGLLAKFRRGAVEAARYGLAHGNLTLAEANGAMRALGIGEFTQDRAHQGRVTVSEYFSTPAQLTPERRGQLRDAVAAAIREALAGFEEITVKTSPASDGTEVVSDTRATTQAVAPAL